MVLVLAGAALFVYLRLKSDLDEGVTAALDARAAAVLASGSASAAVPGDAEEGFALLATPGRPSRPADRFLTRRRAAPGRGGEIRAGGADDPRRGGASARPGAR